MATTQAEVSYWTTLLTTAPAGNAFLSIFENIRHAIEALNQEVDTLRTMEKAVQAQTIGEWANASNYYARAVGSLHFALADWCFALNSIAARTPFNYRRATRAERAEHQIEEPPQASYEEMQQVSLYLFRIYQNMDRIFCLGLALTQRQMMCLTNYMHTAEAQVCNEKEGE
jgi:hypothetical protein